jgi:hypothetical protein
MAAAGDHVSEAEPETAQPEAQKRLWPVQHVEIQEQELKHSDRTRCQVL